LKPRDALDIKRRSGREATFSPRRLLGASLGIMSSINRILLVLLVVIVLGGTAFLVTWEIPPPTARVERVLPDDQFPR
jgi:hypothetical protein